MTEPADSDRSDSSGLARTLRPHHPSAIALGGVIGAGIFISSGASIASSGPATVLSYLVVGLLAAIVMRTLSVLTARTPNSGSFSTHAGEAFGEPGRFAVGWMYWWLMVVTASVECTTAGSNAHQLVGMLPAPAWSMIFISVLTAVNLTPVHVFGEFQFWLVLIKIILILSVPLIALLGLLGLLPNVSGADAANAIYQSGLLPSGFGPVVATMLVAAFSFVGVEMTAIAAGETDRPRRVIPGSLRVVMYTVLCSYVFAMSTTVLLVPWNSHGVATGPFRAMMAALRLPAASTIIDVVVVTAVLSVSNSCIYAASRVGHSLARHKDAPRPWLRLSGVRVPRNAIITSAVVSALLTVVIYTFPSNISYALVASCGAAGVLTWIAIVLSYLKLRPRPTSRLPRDLPAPRRTLAAAALAAIALATMLVGMFFVPSTQLQLIMTLLTLVVIFVVVLWRETNKSTEPID